jgi:hypothetical protein
MVELLPMLGRRPANGSMLFRIADSSRNAPSTLGVPAHIG